MTGRLPSHSSSHPRRGGTPAVRRRLARRSATSRFAPRPSAGALLLALALALGAGAEAAAVEINRVVLRINDRIATLHEYEERRDGRIAAITRSDLSPERKQELLAVAGEETLREMFDEMLLLSRADQLDVTVGDDQVQAAVEQTKASMGLQSDEQFREALARSNLTVEQYLEQTRGTLRLRGVMSREVISRVELTDEDLRRYYQAHPGEFTRPESLRLEEVVVLDSAGSSLTDLASLATELRERLLAGESLDEVLAPLVEGGRVSNRIDLGWVSKGDLDPALEEAAWQLESGGWSEAVAARGGLHLVHLIERRPAELRPFSEVRSEIEAKERDRLFGEEVEEYFHELESRAYIVMAPPPEAAGFRTRREVSPRLGTIRGLDDASLETLAPESVVEDGDDG